MQRDSWYTSMRDAAELAAPEAVGRYAAERALSRLKPRRLPTAEVPVLFESRWPRACWVPIVQATSGGALYRKASFLLDSLGQRVLPDAHRRRPRTRTSAQGQGQRDPFDDEGVRTRARRVVDGGVVQGYFLSSYSARKLGMKTTGHAGGAQNLTLTSRHTTADDTLAGMIRRLHRGLFVTEMMGQGVNG
jgi:PmbA protein